MRSRIPIIGLVLAAFIVPVAAPLPVQALTYTCPEFLQHLRPGATRTESLGFHRLRFRGGDEDRHMICHYRRDFASGRVERTIGTPVPEPMRSCRLIERGISCRGEPSATGQIFAELGREVNIDRRWPGNWQAERPDIAFSTTANGFPMIAPTRWEPARLLLLYDSERLRSLLGTADEIEIGGYLSPEICRVVSERVERAAASGVVLHLRPSSTGEVDHPEFPAKTMQICMMTSLGDIAVLRPSFSPTGRPGEYRVGPIAIDYLYTGERPALVPEDLRPDDALEMPPRTIRPFGP